MNLFKTFSCRAFNILFLAVFSYLFISVFISSADIFIFIALAGFMLIAMLLNIFIADDNKLNERRFYLFLFCCALIFLIVQLRICTKNIFIPSKGDYEAIYTGVKELVNYGEFTDSAAYYLNYPHQLFSTLCFSVLNRIFVMLGSAEPVNVLLTTCAISFFNTIGFCCCAIGTNLLFNKKQAYITVAFFCLNLNAYSGSTFLYPHALSYSVLGPVFLLFALAVKSKKSLLTSIIMFFALGVSLAIAQSTEGIFAIGFVALIIYLFMHYCFKDFLIKLASLLTGFFITLMCLALLYSMLNLFGGVERKNKSLPYEHWIMMGLSEGGTFKEEDYQFSVKIPDTKTRQEEARKIIKQRLEDRSLFQLIEHINEKEVRNWTSMKYGPEFIFYNHETQLITAYNLSLLLGLILLALKKLKQKQVDSIMFYQIWAIGIVFFFALWESSYHYLISSNPIICMSAAAGFTKIDLKRFFIKFKILPKK